MSRRRRSSRPRQVMRLRENIQTCKRVAPGHGHTRVAVRARAQSVSLAGNVIISTFKVYRCMNARPPVIHQRLAALRYQLARTMVNVARPGPCQGNGLSSRLQSVPEGCTSAFSRRSSSRAAPADDDSDWGDLTPGGRSILRVLRDSVRARLPCPCPLPRRVLFAATALHGAVSNECA